MSGFEALGRQWHPNVDEYRSGGIGHREGDESRSVVGFVKTGDLLPYREHDGQQNYPDHDEKVIGSIHDDIKAGKGITNPIDVEYDHRTGWASVGEGNHRLEAARRAGAPVVPVRVYGRASQGANKENGRGASLRQTTSFPDRFANDGQYHPPDLHPDHFDFSRRP